MAANPRIGTGGRWTTASLVLTDGTSVIVPGVTSLSLRNNADNADNFIITDAGAVTFRSTVGGITTLTATTLAGTLSTASQPNVTNVGTLTGTVALASGAVLSWNSGNVTLTHSAGTLTIAGGNVILSAGVVRSITSTAGPHFTFSDDTNTGLEGGGGDVLRLTCGGVFSVIADADNTANGTRMMVYDNTAASARRVTIGVADSGGAGFRVLRIPN